MVLSVLLIPANSAVGGQVLCRSEADDIAALQMFNRAVNAYVELHRLLEAPLAAFRISSDPEVTACVTEKLAKAIRAERHDAMAGDIFGPEVGDLFRVRMHAAGDVREGDGAAIPAGLEGEGAPCAPMPVVNSHFARAGSAPIGDALARALPALPPELEYRLTPRALVLVDVPADLVVDVLELP
jgi:hypothetical protein